MKHKIRVEKHWSGRWFVIVTKPDGSESVDGHNTRAEARRVAKQVREHLQSKEEA